MINLMNKWHHNFAWFISQRIFFLCTFISAVFLLKLQKLQEVINWMNGWCKCLRSYICCKKYLLIWDSFVFLKDYPRVQFLWLNETNARLNRGWTPLCYPWGTSQTSGKTGQGINFFPSKCNQKRYVIKMNYNWKLSKTSGTIWNYFCRGFVWLVTP